MAMFNKEGIQFTYRVEIDRDPNTDPIYTHSFPVLVGNTVQERWTTKVRQIKTLTRMLQGVQLKRNQDYMIDFNDQTQKYEYWFRDGPTAMMFQLMCGHLKQTLNPQGLKFDIECPHCQATFPTEDIKWV